jgi:hypothetical protein
MAIQEGQVNNKSVEYLVAVINIFWIFHSCHWWCGIFKCKNTLAHGQPDCGYKVAQNISEAVPGAWATYFRIPVSEYSLEIWIEKLFKSIPMNGHVNRFFQNFGSICVSCPSWQKSPSGHKEISHLCLTICLPFHSCQTAAILGPWRPFWTQIVDNLDAILVPTLHNLEACPTWTCAVTWLKR